MSAVAVTGTPPATSIEPALHLVPGQSYADSIVNGPAVVQRRAADLGDPSSAGGDVQAQAVAGTAGPAGALPFLDVIQASFGAHDVSGVRAHTDGYAAAAAGAMGASAYATGDHVAFGDAPDLHTAAHEAAHVVQQRAGVHLAGGVGEVGDPYERQADQVADAVVRGESAEPLLGAAATSGQAGSDRAVQQRPRSEPDDGTGGLVGNLLAAIDRSATNGLDALERDDLDTARAAAHQAAERIAHLLSVTAAPGGGRSHKGQKREAAHALGRVAALEAALRSGDAQGAGVLHEALARVEVELVPETHWAWKVEAHGRKAGGGLTRAEGRSIGVGTLSIIARRAQAVLGAREPGPVLATAAAIAEDLGHAHRELALAVRREDQGATQDEVLALGKDLARFETLAYQLGVGMKPPLERMRDAESGLRGALGLKSERVVWESALPTLEAIIDIVNSHVVVKDGMAYDRSQPVSHKNNVPARYHALLDEWFQVTHGRVRNPHGVVMTTRGRDLATHIDDAMVATMPLVHALNQEGNPEQVGPWLEQFYAKVDAFRERATSETVHDHIMEKSDKALAEGASPVDRLDTDTQIKVASARLVSVARQTASIGQRLATTNRDVTRAALEEFKKSLDGIDLPADAKARLTSAQSIVEVSQHIAALANGVEAIINIADPEERERLFVKEFGRSNWAGGVTEIGKNLLWLVQGGIAAYKTLAAAMLVAKGQTGAAATLLGQSAGTLGRINVALNVLNVAHGMVLVVFGSGGDRIDGAVEATWGTLGLVGRWAPRLSRFTGPLAAAIAITHFTFKQIGNAAVGALYGMIQLGLNMAFQDMQRTAQEVHATSMRLAVALESGDELQGQELSQELARQTDALRWNLRDLGLRTYIERTKQPGRNQDPGTWRPLRERFKSLWDAPMATDAELFTTTEVFLSIVVQCFEDAQQILEEAVAASLEEHGH